MGFRLTEEALNRVLGKLGEEYNIYAPKLFEKGSNVSDLDLVRYGQIREIGEAVFDRKSANSFKEAINAISQTLFYFTESAVKEAEAPAKKALVLLRSCDLNALKRLDEIYLRNGNPDYYYERVRQNARFALAPCRNAFESCFCVDMHTNRAGNYDFSIERENGSGVYLVDCKAGEFAEHFKACAEKQLDVVVPFVTGTKTRVRISEKLEKGSSGTDVAALPMWEEYDSRCVNCGRCNFVCPTCTCYSMQDLFYTDNGRAGERRRVWASCMVDGFTDVAGGGSYRKKNGERMRFKVLHKVLDYKQRFGYQMCVGCGRCDDICPEYISFSNTINKLSAAIENAAGEGGK
jgi:anaerobic sulfite reductase subunit A